MRLSKHEIATASLSSALALFGCNAASAEPEPATPATIQSDKATSRYDYSLFPDANTVETKAEAKVNLAQQWDNTKTTRQLTQCILGAPDHRQFSAIAHEEHREDSSGEVWHETNRSFQFEKEATSVKVELREVPKDREDPNRFTSGLLVVQFPKNGKSSAGTKYSDYRKDGSLDSVRRPNSVYGPFGWGVYYKADIARYYPHITHEMQTKYRELLKEALEKCQDAS